VLKRLGKIKKKLTTESTEEKIGSRAFKGDKKDLTTEIKVGLKVLWL